MKTTAIDDWFFVNNDRGFLRCIYNNGASMAVALTVANYNDH